MKYEFKFPDVGEGVHEGKVLKLNYETPANIKSGDILAVVETDKVVAEIPSPKDGILQSYNTTEGQIIEVGQTLAVIETGKDEPIQEKIQDQDKISEEKNIGKQAAGETVEEAGAVVGEIEGPGKTILPASGEGILDRTPESLDLKPGGIKVLATPLARKIASDNNINLDMLKGSGPSGRILKQDILDIINTQGKNKKQEIPEHEKLQAAKTVPEKTGTPGKISRQDIGFTLKTIEPEIIPLSQIRKTIARNMEESWKIPAFTIHDSAPVDKLVNLRNSINSSGDVHLSFIPFFMKAMAAALRYFPDINSTYDSDKTEITRYSEINIAFAVNTDAGLIVPVLNNVESKSIIQLDFEIKELSQAARSRTIPLEKTRHGTISLTNYGSYGGIYGRPLIMPPQVAIIGFGRIHETAAVINGEIGIVKQLPVSLVADHRVIDGAPAGMFLKKLMELISDPDRLLVYL